MNHCHLLAVGKQLNLGGFTASTDWPEDFLGLEPLELSPTRRLWQFEVEKLPLVFLHAVSLKHSQVTLLLDFDDGRVKGLVLVKNGTVQRCQLRYRS